LVTETNHTLKEIEIEADDLDAANQVHERAAARFDRNWEQDRWHLFIGDTDYGRPDDWPYGELTEAEQETMWPDSFGNSTVAPGYRVDWIERLTLDQQVEEAEKHQAWLDDPVAQARFRATKQAWGLPTD
jgi:hypothetical protein